MLVWAIQNKILTFSITGFLLKKKTIICYYLLYSTSFDMTRNLEISSEWRGHQQIEKKCKKVVF